MTITGKTGDVVMISKADYDALIETLYINSIPGLVNHIKSADPNDPSQWINEDDMEW